MTNGYPKRNAYFAHRYCRLLTKTCAAQEIGHIAFVLCVTIAHQEDAKRYKGPVTYFNEQLTPLIGVTKWVSLDNARNRAVKAGWLHYEPGNRGQRLPGRYWVTIPAHLDDLIDGACDETQYPAKGEWNESQYTAKGDRGGERRGEREGDRGGEHSTLCPIPNKTRRSKAALIYEIPESLKSESFQAAWGEWLEYRKTDKHKSVSARAAKIQLQDLEALGPDRAIQAIRHSIKHDYQGIFEPSSNGNGQAVAESKPVDDLPLLKRKR